MLEDCKSMGKEKLRVRLYWFLNVDAFSTICVAMILLALHFPEYWPLRIAAPASLLCLVGGMAFTSIFYEHMGWDKERIPPKSVKDVWRYITIILCLLSALKILTVGLPKNEHTKCNRSGGDHVVKPV
jgi:hypothetical protein